MAQRRMFSPDIICSEEFLEMPVSSRDLYIQLAIRADDDGFIQPKIVMRMIGSDGDDLKILIAKRFLLAFDDGVVVIKHWLIHNIIRADRYKLTRFQEQKRMLQIKDNKAYTELGLQNDNQMAPQVRLGKVRLGKVDMSEKSDDSFESFWKAYPKKEMKRKSKEIWSRKKLSAHLVEILSFVEQAKQTERWIKGFVKQPTAFLNGECWNDDISAYGGTESKNNNQRPMSL